MNNFTKTSNFTVGGDYLQGLMPNITNVTLPGVNFRIPEGGARSGVANMFGSDSILYNTISIDVLLDEKMEVYKNILNKIQDTVDIYDNTFNTEPFDMWVEVHDNFGSSILKIEYYDCRFESIGDVDFFTDDDEELVLNITIRVGSSKLIK
jgi:hypothetical protein